MFSLNKVFLLGHIGKIEGQKEIGSFKFMNVSLALNEEWKDKETGNKKTRTDWILIKFFNKSAEIAGKTLNIGDKIIVEGRIRNDSYKDKEGKTKNSFYITVEKFNIANHKKLYNSNNLEEGKKDENLNENRYEIQDDFANFDDAPF